jgi:hypothetical protein
MKRLAIAAALIVISQPALAETVKVFTPLALPAIGTPPFTGTFGVQRKSDVFSEAAERNAQINFLREEVRRLEEQIRRRGPMPPVQPLE